MTQIQADSRLRPDEIDDATVEAVGAVSEALECVERARGDLYSFHQLIGHADLLLGDACDKLRNAGYAEVDGAADCCFRWFTNQPHPPQLRQRTNQSSGMAANNLNRSLVSNAPPLGNTTSMWTTRRRIEAPATTVWNLMTTLDKWPKWGRRCRAPNCQRRSVAPRVTRQGACYDRVGEPRSELGCGAADPKTNAEQFPGVKKLLDMGLQIIQYTFSSDDESQADKLYRGASPSNDGTELSTAVMTERFPMTIAPERREEFSPGFDKELLALIQATAEVKIATYGAVAK